MTCGQTERQEHRRGLGVLREAGTCPFLTSVNPLTGRGNPCRERRCHFYPRREAGVLRDLQMTAAGSRTGPLTGAPHRLCKGHLHRAEVRLIVGCRPARLLCLCDDVHGAFERALGAGGRSPRLPWPPGLRSAGASGPKALGVWQACRGQTAHPAVAVCSAVVP